MKYFVSISLLVIYLAGTIQPSWFLIDFYMNREEMTRKFCVNLDKGITMCRASCYLENVKKERTKESDKKIVIPEKIKTVEVITQNQKQNLIPEAAITVVPLCYVRHYTFTYLASVFHPPKITLFS